MGKRARMERQKAIKELSEMAAIAGDLNHLMQAKYLVGGFICRPVLIQAPGIGQVPGCEIVFTMQDGSQHGPIVMEPVSIIHLVARMSAAAAGLVLPDEPEMPDQEGDEADEPDTPGLPGEGGEVTLESGLIIPT